MSQTLYQFVLPDVANDGTTDYTEARRGFERDALSIAGGFTYLGTVMGAWQDHGRVFHERNHLYQVAVPFVAHEVTAAALTDAAFRRFPDQLAIYRAEIGKGAMVERRDAVVGADVPLPPLAASAAPLTLSDM